MSIPDKITVQYEFVGEHHIFTSKDVKGFFVANKDREKAVQAIPALIKLMLEMNHNAIGIESVVPETYCTIERMEAA